MSATIPFPPEASRRARHLVRLRAPADRVPARAVSVRLPARADLAHRAAAVPDRVAPVRVPVPRVTVVPRAAARVAVLALTRR